MHIAFALDTTQSTASERARLFVNGSRVTAFSTATYPSQNSDLLVGDTNLHLLGRISGFSYDFDGYLADLHFCDGTAYDASAFGEFSATTGVWMPKAFSGSYGSQGWKLDFADNSAATAAALGKDTSGNGNNFTPTNLSVTAGAGNDSLIDVPVNGSQTDTGLGGQVRGNYCTWNPLTTGGGQILSNGNLDVAQTSGTGSSRGTVGVSSGKWYWEVTVNTIGGGSDSVGIVNATTATGFNSYANGNVVGLAFDADSGKLFIAVNNTWVGSGNPVTGVNPYASSLTTGPYTPWIQTQRYSANSSYTANFGARAFSYTAPSGYKALCTSSLSTPTIVKPSTVMDVVLYTGTGSTLTPTSSLGFSPDLVWIKSRSAATDHALYDAVRGAQARLESNVSDAEVTSDNGLTAFNSAGFTLGTLAQVNTSSATYAAWTWDAGSSTVTNTAGTITSSVRANASAGFSVVTFTYPSSGSFTAGHGLGVAPSLIITKHRNRSSDWYVYHMSATSTNQYLVLNSTAAVGSATDVWGTAAPTSTVFGGKVGTSGISGDTEVAYCFAPVAGYSSFGSYTGNGSADGPFVFTGMRPRYLLIKNITTAYGWAIHDTARYPYNEDESLLYANATTAETTNSGFGLDVLSNGFKIRCTSAATVWNETNSVYVYAAFAESPFQYSRAR
jgi:hypothetical protein